MPIVYTEGRSLASNFYADLRAAILSCSDWSSLVSEAAILTTTAASAAAATTLTFANGSPAAAGVTVGSVIRVGARNDPLVEWRAVTAVAATTVTVAALTSAHASGTSVYWGNEIFKATTTRGSDMIFDLVDIPMSATAATNTGITAYSSFQTGVQTNPKLNPSLATSRYLAFKFQNQGPATATYIYWTLSISKEHIFLMVEGPKATDANPDSVQYGSARNYMFFSDLVPYFNSSLDPRPAVVLHMSPNATSKTTAAFSHKCNVDQTHDGKYQLASGYLHSLDLPGNAIGPLSANRMGLDGNLFLSPYVYFDDIYGIRGRLSSLFYVGPNTNYEDWGNVPVTANTFTTYGGIKYKILAINKGGANSGGPAAGALGWFDNSSTTAMPRMLASPLVAVPYALA